MEFINTFDGKLEFANALESEILKTFGGWRTVANGYCRVGSTLIRMKDHDPRYTRVYDEIESERYARMIDIRIGYQASQIFGNDDDKQELLEQYPNCLVEMEVKEYATVAEVVAFLHRYFDPKSNG